MFGLRLGQDPRVVVTSTPRPSKLIKDLAKDPQTILTRGRSFDNRANLAPAFLKQIVAKYQGTRLGRQELDGEILDDNPNALWKRQDIEKGRLRKAPEMQRIVIPIDPAVTSNEGSDMTGIVPVGVDNQDPEHFYVLEDLSLSGSPDAWAKAAVKAYLFWQADRIVAETNNGGDMVEGTIRNVVIEGRPAGKNVSYEKVTATRGKAIRAEPVAALYEQGRVHHIGTLPELEDQLCDFDPTDEHQKSPDRMDSLVWGITALMGGGEGYGFMSFYERETRKGGE
jgi:phage terminase large subunit-like protein